MMIETKRKGKQKRKNEKRSEAGCIASNLIIIYRIV